MITSKILLGRSFEHVPYFTVGSTDNFVQLLAGLDVICVKYWQVRGNCGHNMLARFARKGVIGALPLFSSLSHMGNN